VSLNLPQIPEKLRGPLKYVGYTLFAIFVFIVVLYLTFPYDKVKDRVEAEAGSSGDIEVTIRSLGPSPLFGISASDVVLQQKTPAGGAPAGDKKPMRIAIDRVSLSFSPFGFIFGRKGYDFSADAFGGRVSGSWVDAKGDVTLKLKLKHVALAAIPGLRDAVELPMSGTLSGTLEITMPKGRMGQAHGEAELACDACTVGDGKARLKIPAATAMFAEGVLVDRVQLGKFGGRITIEKGVAKLQSFGAKSADLELQLEGEIALSDSIGSSSVRTGYITFRPSESGKKKQPFMMMDLALAQTAKRPDGFFGWRVAGLIRSPNFTASKTSPIQPSAPGRPGVDRPGARPTATAGRAALGGGRITPPGARSPMPGGPPPVGAPPPPQPEPPPAAPAGAAAGPAPVAPAGAPPPAAPPTPPPEQPPPEQPPPEQPPAPSPEQPPAPSPEQPE
jgi:type II secretion system protein N